jgi:hypothetical protein
VAILLAEFEENPMQAGLGGILYSRRAPAVIASDSLRPMAPWGLQIGAEQRIQTLVGRADRHVPYGRDLDVFVLDMRSYRGPNTFNRQEQRSAETAFLGRAQIAWLKSKLEQSRATWKIVAADMPIGLQVGDGTDAQGRPRWEAVANGDGPVLGRELEIAEILRFIKREEIRNVVWHLRCALLRAALLRSQSRAVPGLRAVLGIRRGAAARRQLRTEPARQHLWATGRVPEGAASREHAAERRLSVLRADRHRPAQQASHCLAEGHRRHDGVHEAARCDTIARRKMGFASPTCNSCGQAGTLGFTTRLLSALGM